MTADGSQRLASRVAAIFTLAQGLGTDDAAVLVKLGADPSVAAWAIRALADHVPTPVVAATIAATRPVVVAGLASQDARTRREPKIWRCALAKHVDAINPREWAEIGVKPIRSVPREFQAQHR